MHFFKTLFAAALVAVVAAKPEIHNYPRNIEPGKTYEITYSPADDTPTTFVLRQGKDLNLDKVDTLTTSATKGKFSWTVSKDLPNRNDYALEIIQGPSTNNNYVGPIKLTGSTATQAPSSASSSVPASSSGSASTSAKPTGSFSTTVSGAVSTSVGSNSTVTSPTPSATTPAPTSARTTPGSGPPRSTGAASNLGSPLALVLGGFAAMVYFN